MRAALVLALLALACAAHAQVATLRLLTNYTQSLGARCLDGSAPGTLRSLVATRVYVFGRT